MALLYLQKGCDLLVMNTEIFGNEYKENNWIGQ